MVARAPEDRGSARKPERDGAADTAAAGSADAFDADAPNDENGDGDMPARNDDDEDSTGPPQARKGSSSRSIGASVASLAAALGVTTVKPRLVPVDGSLDRRRAESFPAAWANQELADAADEALAVATGSPTAGGAAANAAGRGGGASGGGKPMAEPLPALPDSPEQGFDVMSAMVEADLDGGADGLGCAADARQRRASGLLLPGLRTGMRRPVQQAGGSQGSVGSLLVGFGGAGSAARPAARVGAAPGSRPGGPAPAPERTAEAPGHALAADSEGGLPGAPGAHASPAAAAASSAAANERPAAGGSGVSARPARRLISRASVAHLVRIGVTGAELRARTRTAALTVRDGPAGAVDSAAPRRGHAGSGAPLLIPSVLGRIGVQQPRQPTSVIVTDASGRPWLCRAKMTASPRPDTPLRRCRPNLRIDQDLIVEPYGEEDDEERWPDEFQDRPKPENEPEWDADAGASSASPAEEQQPESGQQPEQDDADAAAAADDACGGAEGTGDAAADDAAADDASGGVEDTGDAAVEDAAADDSDGGAAGVGDGEAASMDAATDPCDSMGFYEFAAPDIPSAVAEGRQWLRDRIEATVSSPPPVKAGAATPGEA